MRTVLMGVGVIAIAAGAVWMGQGTGVFPYPATSFMVNDRAWIWWGLLLAVLGAVLIAAARRF